MNAERLLKLILRAVGVVTLFATPAVFMPTSWMAGIHHWLGLGTFPDTPIVQYLARSVSAFYAMLGGLLLVVSGDLRRHAVLITYLAVVGLVFGVVMTVIDVTIRLPILWAVLIELPLVPLCTVMLVLQRRIRSVPPPRKPGEGK